MSHTIGKILKNQRVVGFIEYNGTVGFACTAIRNTVEEIHKYWRTNNIFKKCSCGKEAEPVIVYEGHGDEGGSSYWQGKACFTCMALTDGDQEFSEIDQEYGVPACDNPDELKY